MVYSVTAWLMVSTLAGPLVNMAAAQPASPGAVKTVPSSTGSPAESLAQKQRTAALTAMQASVEKQRAAVADGLAASNGKSPANALAAAPEAFFMLPPMPPSESL